MTLELRNATIEDAGILAEMNRQLIEDEGSRNPMSLEQLHNRMRGWLSDNWSAVIVSKGDTIMGYLLYQMRADQFRASETHVFVRQFFVQREYRRRGIGRTAFEQIVSQYFKDADGIQLDVLYSNDQAVRFWENIGFKPYSMTMARPIIIEEP